MYTGGPLAAYVPFEADRIAEPPEGAPEIDMLEVLPAVVAERYGDFSLLLRPDAVTIAKERSRCFRRVLGDPAEFLKYLGRRRFGRFGPSVRPTTWLPLARWPPFRRKRQRSSARF